MVTLPTFCGKDCGGDACPMLATLDAGRVTRLSRNPSAGDFLNPCRRGYRLADETYSPERILHPLIRVGPRGSGQFRRAAWDEALDLTAARLSAVRERYGANAILSQGSAGSTGALHATHALLLRFLTLFGGCTTTTGNYSNAAASYILPYVLGSSSNRSGFDAATMRHAKLIVLWGANLLETRFGAGIPEHLLAARRSGADAALMLAVLHVLLSEDLADRAFIAAHSAGFEQLERYVLGQEGQPTRTPEWAAPICGLPADEITRFARVYAAAKPAMLFPGYSIQRVYAGEETFRLTIALQVATGNFGVLGGSTGSINNRLPGPRVGQLPAPSRAGLPSIPVVRWPDAVLTGRAGGFPSDIHAIYNLGSNAVNQGGDARKSLAAFMKLDFAVTHELFLTPTARCCDVVFPAASALEKTDIGQPWAGNYLLYKPQVLPPAGEARSDYDALWALADRLGFGDQFSQGRTQADWIDHFIAESEIPDPETFKRTGIYLAPDQERVGLADFAADPLAHPLGTPSGLVEIASQRYHAETGFPAIPTWQEPPADPRYPLSLITPKSPRRTHSQGDHWAPKPGHSPESSQPHALQMHPSDAQARGINDDDRVHVFNDQGHALIPVHLTTDLAPGVVSLLEGVWLSLDAEGIDRAGSANVFTAAAGTRPGAAAIMHAIPVQVEADRQENP